MGPSEWCNDLAKQSVDRRVNMELTRTVADDADAEFGFDHLTCSPSKRTALCEEIANLRIGESTFGGQGL